MTATLRCWMLCAAVISLSTVAVSQNFLVHRPFGAGLGMEVILPQIKSDPGESTVLTLFQTTVHLRAGERSVLHLALPYMRYSYHASSSSPYYNYTFNQQDDGVMNLTIGLLSSPTETSLWELMVTIPMISDQNAGLGFSGILTDFDRFESYLQDDLAIGAYGDLLTPETSTFVGRIRLGPSVWIPTNDGRDEVEATLDAGAGIGVRFGSFEVGAFASTRTIMTEEKLFGDKTVIHLTFSAQATISRFVVQTYYRLPQNDMFQRVLHGTLGITGIVTW